MEDIVKIEEQQQGQVVAETGELQDVFGDEEYRQFAGAEKACWAEMGVNPLTEAEQSRRDAEVGLEVERQSLEKYREKVEGLRADIDEKKSRFLTRILAFRQIQELERDLGIAERSHESAERMVKSMEQLSSAYNRVLTEEQELGIIMEEAYTGECQVGRAKTHRIY